MDIANILNILSFFVPIAWLAVILAYWLKKHEVDFKLVKYGILTVMALFVLEGAYGTIATYNAWKLDPISRYLLPPHQTWYFYTYAYFHFWRTDLINFLAGAAWAIFLFLIYKYSAGRVLDKNDVALGFFTALIVGWPKIFAYLAIAFGLLAAKGIINAAILKNQSNLTIASSIALSALIVAGFGNFLMRLPFFDNLKL